MNCPKCGAPVAATFSFCENCGCPLERQSAPQQPTVQQPVAQQPLVPPSFGQPAYAQPVQPRKPENVVAGIVGALLGAVLGAASIILLGQLGYISAISGVILAVCTLKGYELLGGRLSTVGLVVSVVLMLVTPYVADRIDWALMLMNETIKYDFGEAFAVIPELIGNEDNMLYIETGTYYGNLALLYLFTLLGGLSNVISAFKRK